MWIVLQTTDFLLTNVTVHVRVSVVTFPFASFAKRFRQMKLSAELQTLVHKIYKYYRYHKLSKLYVMITYSLRLLNEIIYAF